MDNLKKGSVLILDFGSQYTQLIARRVRENYIFSEVLPPSTTLKTIMRINPKAIILSGGPSSVFLEDAPIFDKNILSLDIPILGICYGLQLITKNFGGKIKSSNKKREFGRSELHEIKKSKLTKNFFKKKKYNIFVINSDGVKFTENSWKLSETYIYLKQSKSLISDKHSRKYLKLSTRDKLYASKISWGE